MPSSPPPLPPPGDGLAAVAVVTVRSRAVFKLPSEYTFVYIELRAAHLKNNWTTQKVPVINGTALVDFWARIPCAGAETRIELKVQPKVARIGRI